LRYCGPTKFATGIWAGVELTKPVGKHDGSLAGIRYFTCSKNFGIFCQLDKLEKYDLPKAIESKTKYYHNKYDLHENGAKKYIFTRLE
jgi:dynactin complex subunit